MEFEILKAISWPVLVSAIKNLKNGNPVDHHDGGVCNKGQSRGVVEPIHYYLIFFGKLYRGIRVPQNTMHYLILTSELVQSCVFPYMSGDRKLMSIHKNV